MTSPSPSPLGLPAATYRIQFSPQFTFAQAAELVPYLHGLGISECYASPILTARRGSAHGYDTVDHATVSAELGGERALKALCGRLRDAGMGLIVDIVPNHMCVTDDRNRWWQDVLEHGADSAFAEFFDIDWSPPDPSLQGKVLLPVLGDRPRRVIAAGGIALAWHDGTLRLRVYEQHLPVSVQAWPPVLRALAACAAAEAGAAHPGAGALHALLEECARLAAGDPAGTERRAAEASLRARLREWVERTPGADRWLEPALARFRGEEGLTALQALLQEQHYLLAFWRHAAYSVNYRRYFDINDLAGLRVEVPRVFDAVHGTILRLIEEGCIAGLRVDHPDGLHDPAGYFRKLQAHCARAAAAGTLRSGLRMPSPDAPFYIVAEKFLGADERLREDWPIHGTTGYEYLNQAGNVFIVPEHERAFERFYRSFTEHQASTAEILRECKRLVLEEHFGGELERLTQALVALIPEEVAPEPTLQIALIELIASFPVYRTYVTGRPVRAEDRLRIEQGLGEAERRNPHLQEALVRIGSLLLLEGEEPLAPAQLAFVMAFQQLTGPAMAKGLEDTALYRYFPLISLSTVGSGPGRFGITVPQFHEANRRRLASHPFGLSATSTHDTKRSEDVRARINALSEVPELWSETVRRWVRMNALHRRRLGGTTAPDLNEEYLLYQTLAGAWPLGGRAAPEWEEFPERMQAYAQKALREAKVHTTWGDPDFAYEQAVREFIAALLSPSAENPFPADMEAFLAPVVRAGLWNALSRTVLKVASPGVPDFYQGTELWDFSLVDPDNRRPVDFDLRRELLATLDRDAAADPVALVERLLREPENGWIKLYVTSRLLRFRRDARALLTTGEYLPLDVQGAAARHGIAFARAEGGKRVIALAGRFFLMLTAAGAAGGGAPLGEQVWRDTAVRLPAGWGAAGYRDLLTGRRIVSEPGAGGAVLSLGEAFRHLPVAFLEELDR